MTDWLDEYLSGGGLPEPETWTPKIVGDRLIEAVRWVHYCGGRVGPAGMCASGAFAFHPTLEDHLEEGWGLPEVAGDVEEDERSIYRSPTAEQITAYEAALQWPAEYLIPDHSGSARVLNLWVRCKVHNKSFASAITRRGTMSRGAAYRLRDRGLSLISQGLDRNEVPL